MSDSALNLSIINTIEITINSDNKNKTILIKRIEENISEILFGLSLFSEIFLVPEI
jgi:hypothetical protein